MTVNDVISEFDCRPAPKVQSESLPAPDIDYLARDYASFRRLMLDRLSAILPDWHERSPADVGVAIVEVLAHAADQLSYYQDAVATEAYLGTARQRISVKRHARLLGYTVHEGCNARVWVQFDVNGNVTLDQRTPLLTQVDGLGRTVVPNSSDFYQALASGAQVFETLHLAHLIKEHNEFPIHAADESSEYYLRKDSIQATLRGPYEKLQAGDVLIFEEVRGSKTGLEKDANPDHRHAVRLTKVTPNSVARLTTIEWHTQDALPFDLHVSRRIAGTLIMNMAVARGNVVLADYGRTLKEDLAGGYRPRLRHSDLTYTTPYNEASTWGQAASDSLTQDPRDALPVITLDIGGESWTVRRDLLNSNRFARDFVVEVDNAGRAQLRFGDGVRGQRPPDDSIPKATATYRIGNGLPGNVGREAIGHVVTSRYTDNQIDVVRNPLPARGGARPESIEQVQLHAPQAFRAQERCVTAADYVAVAQRHPEVDRAAAALQWTGGWHTMFVAIERKGGRPVDPAFAAELRAFFERYRLAGYDLKICPPRFVPLDIALTVHVAPHSFRSTVNQALLEIFSDVDLPDGRRGFFHPDNLTFAQPVYLSQVVAAAMQAPGVNWVKTDRFHRWGQPPRDEQAEGQVKLGQMEIVCLDNDPEHPENGRIEFELKDGL